MRNLGMYTAVMAMAGGFVLKEKKLPRLKRCLNCGKGHEHNNSFCSALCCKKYGSDPLIEDENAKTQSKNTKNLEAKNV